MQVSCAGVITQAGPQGEHIVDVGIGEGFYCGKTRQKAGVIGNNRLHLRLLQHDFRQPDPVRVGRLLPG